MMDGLIEKMRSGAALESTDIRNATGMLLDEEASVESKVAFLRALAEKGESPDEIAGFVDAFLEHAVAPVLRPADIDKPTIDVCGTGGDKLDLFNVSTTSIFLLAAGGAAVVKHGNRGITSKSGGADVLEALGVKIDLDPARFAECVQAHGAAFMLAPQYHPAFKAVVPVRKQLAEEGVRTIFNLIGPLLNPVRPDYQLVGVFDAALPPVYAEILGKLGRKASWAVHGNTEDGRGMDEVSICGPTQVATLKGGVVEASEVTPEDFGLQATTTEALRGGGPEENAKIVEAILSGADTGPKRDMVLANSAAGFVVAGLADDLAGGFERARTTLEDGSALATLRAMQEFA